MKRRVICLLVALLLVPACSLKPQHEAIGPGDTGDEPAQADVFKGAFKARLTHTQPEGAAIKPSSAVRDAGPFVLGIAALLLSGGNPMFTVAAVAGADVAKTALQVDDNKERHNDTIEVDIPRGYALVWIRQPDGGVMMQMTPVTPQDAPNVQPATPVVDDAVVKFLDRYKVDDPGVQPPGIAPK